MVGPHVGCPHWKWPWPLAASPTTHAPPGSFRNFLFCFRWRHLHAKIHRRNKLIFLLQPFSRAQVIYFAFQGIRIHFRLTMVIQYSTQAVISRSITRSTPRAEPIWHEICMVVGVTALFSPSAARLSNLMYLPSMELMNTGQGVSRESAVHVSWRSHPCRPWRATPNRCYDLQFAFRLLIITADLPGSLALINYIFSHKFHFPPRHQQIGLWWMKSPSIGCACTLLTWCVRCTELLHIYEWRFLDFRSN